VIDTTICQLDRPRRCAEAYDDG